MLRLYRVCLAHFFGKESHTLVRWLQFWSEQGNVKTFMPNFCSSVFLLVMTAYHCAWQCLGKLAMPRPICLEPWAEPVEAHYFSSNWERYHFLQRVYSFIRKAHFNVSVLFYSWDVTDVLHLTCYYVMMKEAMTHLQTVFSMVCSLLLCWQNLALVVCFWFSCSQPQKGVQVQFAPKQICCSRVNSNHYYLAI